MRRIAFLLLLPLALIACSDDDGDGVTSSGAASASSGSASGSAAASGSGSGSSAGPDGCQVIGGTDAEATGEVRVVLDEWSVAPDKDSVAAGAITFDVTNEGDEPHELVIVQDGEELVELEAFAAGETCTGTFELAAGDYELVCAIVEEHDGETEDHAAEGMRTPFTVT